MFDQRGRRAKGGFGLLGIHGLVQNKVRTGAKHIAHSGSVTEQRNCYCVLLKRSVADILEYQGGAVRIVEIYQHSLKFLFGYQANGVGIAAALNHKPEIS